MNTFKEFLLLEGGAAGHMAHPFDLRNIKTGNDLIKLFNAIENSVKRNKTAVKFDGLNASVKLIKNDTGNYQYAFDRGSAKPIDLKGITKDNVLERFEKGHGMIAVVNFLLPILDSTIETTMPEITKLGLKKPNRFLNLEYVTGQTNVTSYDRNMIVIHGINEFVPRYAKNKRLLSRASVEVSYSKEVLNEFVKKIQPVFKQHNFEVFGPTKATVTREPKFENILNKPFGIAFSDTDTETRTLSNWLKIAKNPVNIFVKNTQGKKIPAMSKSNYLFVLGGNPISKLVGEDKNSQKAVADGAIFYHATRMLGNELLSSLGSAAGDLSKHEGIVIRDTKVASVPVKITGEFIVRGMESKFQKSEQDENLQLAPGVTGLIGSLNYANTTGNYMQNKSYLRQPPYDSPPNPGAYVG
jgi:hypothetical protein